GPNGAASLDRLDADADNLRAALDWAIERGDAAYALRFLIAVWRFWQFRGHLHEAAVDVARILAIPGVDAQPADLQARAFGAAGGVHYWRAEFDRTNALYAQALEQARLSGDRAILAEALYNFGFASQPGLREQTDVFRLGRPWFEEALALYTDLGDEAGIASVNWALAFSAIADRDLPLARRYTDASIASQRARGDAFGLAWGLHLLGLIDVHERLHEDAARTLGEGLRLFAAAGDTSGIVILLADFAIAARARGDLDRMWRLAGAAERLNEQAGTNLITTTLEYLDWVWPELPADDPEARRIWEQGAA